MKRLKHAIDAGMMIDSADAYGNGHNESLLAQALEGKRKEAFIATKFGIVFDENARSVDVTFGESEMRIIDEIMPPGAAVGATLV